MSRTTYSLNGLTKQQPRGATYIVKTLPRKEYLQSVLNRLKNDVSPIIACIEQYNRAVEDKIGFFPMARIMMPIIEVVASSEGRLPQSLMKDLGMALPYTKWNAYRDILLHNDEFVTLGVDNLGLQVAIFLTSKEEQSISELLARDGRNIDPFRIHRLLVEYLENKIQEIPEDATVEIIGELIYDSDSTDPEIQGAIKEIRDFHTRTSGMYENEGYDSQTPPDKALV